MANDFCPLRESDNTPTARTDAVLTRSDPPIFPPAFDLTAVEEGVWDWDWHLAGYAPGEVAASMVLFQHWVHADDWSAVHDVLQASLSGKTRARVVECRMRCGDGPARWIFGSVHVVERTADGQALRMVGVVTDISERKRREQNYWLQNQIVGQIVEGVVLVDRDSRVRYTSPNFDALFGYGRGELLGQSIGVLNGGDASASAEKANFVMSKLARDGHWHGELRSRHKDGTEFWTEARISAFEHTEFGPVWGCVQWDITVQKQRDDSLKQAEAFAALILETIAAAILVINEQGQIVRVNSNANACFGYAGDALLARPVTDLIPRHFYDEYLRSGTGFAGESVLPLRDITLYLFARRQDGSEFPAEIALGPMPIDGHRYVVISLSDISPRLQAEDKIHVLSAELASLVEARTDQLHSTEAILTERTQELRLALQRIGVAERQKVEEERKRLSQDLHDEIGQMLAALSLNLEVIRRQHKHQGVPPPLQNAIRITEDVVHGVRRIVHQLRPPQLDEFGLGAAIRWHLRQMVSASLVAITLEDAMGERRLPPELEMACFRIVQECLTNALRHASAKNIHIHLFYQREVFHALVRDDGVGFNVDAIQQAESYGGHFGLRGMRERAQGAGGDLAITTAPGLGCSVCAMIPQKTDPTAAP